MAQWLLLATLLKSMSAFSFVHQEPLSLRPFSSQSTTARHQSADDDVMMVTPIEDYNGGLPTQFTFPFHYHPHAVAIHASEKLRSELSGYAFLKEEPGKMFGVLIVTCPSDSTDSTGSSLGYLKAYSGTLKVPLPGFCPLLYDRLAPVKDGEFCYTDGEDQLNQLTRQVEALEQNPERIKMEQEFAQLQKSVDEQMEESRVRKRQNKKQRKQQREEQRGLLSEQDFEALEEELRQESAFDQRQLRALKVKLEAEMNEMKTKMDETYAIPIEHLKEKRQSLSTCLTQALFEHYQFLNVRGHKANLLDIFQSMDASVPPGGAGDCAAPKLLQYAFAHGYKPIAMAEFWWNSGSDNDGLRKHNFYYPACRGKCHPILMGHMLQGLDLEANPLEQEQTKLAEIKTVYEDEYILVVDKPAEVLSVPGRLLQASVYTHAQERYPNATGPLLVHRLDMSTSGLLLIAKDKDSHKHLSKQFIARSVKKRYECLLEGCLDPKREKHGKIELPLMSDYLHRPMQQVDWEKGKPAVTHYEVLSTDKEGRTTRVYFYPVTGRTHQLRVHAAHEQGLNLPIVGDDIYGQRLQGQRLCLHAGLLEFSHPVTEKRMKFTSDAPF